MKANCPITVESLRKQGYKVRVTHYRQYYLTGFNPLELCTVDYCDYLSRKEAEEEGLKHSQVLSNGGFTFVEITCPDQTQLVGKVNFSPAKQFNRKLALRIALGRALKGNK